jgi:predicted phosphate transport protein (TIGR00153 family)
MALFKSSKSIIRDIEEYINKVDQGGLHFKKGVIDFLDGRNNDFQDVLASISKEEAKADSLRRKIENELYSYSLLPEHRGDVMRLLEKTDDIIDMMKENLYQFDVEDPFVPEEIHDDLKRLSELSISAVEELLPALRVYFTDPIAVKDRLHRVYFYEKETDKLAMDIKRKIFKQVPNLLLSQKIHLRYFTLHIENVSDAAETVADILTIMAIKRIQ